MQRDVIERDLPGAGEADTLQACLAGARHKGLEVMVTNPHVRGCVRV